MLVAHHHPSMGSSKPPNRDMPFGYSFNDEFPFPPPAPAPGPSLLDDSESKFMENFFDGVGSDGFNTADFFDKAFVSSGYGGNEQLPFGWQECAPSFMGTSSSYGSIQTQTQQSSHELPGNAFGMLSNDMPAGTSADVLAAATILGGPNSNHHDHHNTEGIGMGNEFFSAHEISRDLQTGPPASNQSRASLQSASMTPFPASREGSTSTTNPRKDEFVHDPFYSDLVFGSTPPASARPSKPEDIRWGSDSGFGAASFIAPPGQESQRRLERDMLKQLDCFTPKLEMQYQPSSAATTQPSSPMITRLHKEDMNRNRRQSVQIISSTYREEIVESNFQQSRKRRKSTSAVKYEVDEENEENDSTPKPAPLPSRKRKHSTSKSTECAPHSAASKRRKSTQPSAGGNCSSDNGKSKSTRENLTEDQKRENHIRSEQKRRTLIKEGFEDLGELVPELASGGFSKSAVLLMAGEWLEALIRGNEVLRGQLSALEGRGMGHGGL